MALVSKTVQLAAVIALALPAVEASAKNFNLTMQSAQVAKRIKAARPAPPPKARSKTVTTSLSCKGGRDGIAWTCPGIAAPGTRATLTYSVSLTD